MLHREKNISARGIIILLLIILNVLCLKIAFIHNHNWYWGLLITMPLMLIAIADVRKSKQHISRHHPGTSHLKYLFNEPKRASHTFRLSVTQLFQKMLSPGNH